MRLAAILACAAALVALVVAGGGSAPAASPRASVKLDACQTGDAPRDRLATFHGRMKAVSGAARMWMRFTLFERTGDEPAQVVSAPGLRVWRKSRTGVKKFGYAQTVQGLEVGGAYSAQVRYRWYDDDGELIKTSRKTSAECLIAGDLPNLRIADVRGIPGPSPGTESYSVDVKNDGRAKSAAARVELVVDGAAPDATSVSALEPGEAKTVHVTGPACSLRIRAVVDREDSVRESAESDNTLRSGCPSAAGAPGL